MGNGKLAEYIMVEMLGGLPGSVTYFPGSPASQPVALQLENNKEPVLLMVGFCH